MEDPPVHHPTPHKDILHMQDTHLAIPLVQVAIQQVQVLLQEGIHLSQDLQEVMGGIHQVVPAHTTDHQADRSRVGSPVHTAHQEGQDSPVDTAPRGVPQGRPVDMALQEVQDSLVDMAHPEVRGSLVDMVHPEVPQGSPVVIQVEHLLLHLLPLHPKLSYEFQSVQMPRQIKASYSEHMIQESRVLNENTVYVTLNFV